MKFVRINNVGLWLEIRIGCQLIVSIDLIESLERILFINALIIININMNCY